MSKKIKSIVIDTLTAIQSNEYMTDKRKPGHDKWKDYGQAIYTFIYELQKRGFEIVYILGEPGTGKSSGMRTLEPDTNIWYNADAKNPTWIGGKEAYGRKVNAIKPFHIIPESYEEIISHIDKGLSKDIFEEDRVAFVLGHTETYKAGDEVRERLKVLGSMASKFQLEGKAENVMYSKVKREGNGVSYILETQNNGYNSARSDMGKFEPTIENDYQLILNTILD